MLLLSQHRPVIYRAACGVFTADRNDANLQTESATGGRRIVEAAGE